MITLLPGTFDICHSHSVVRVIRGKPMRPTRPRAFPPQTEVNSVIRFLYHEPLEIAKVGFPLASCTLTLTLRIVRQDHLRERHHCDVELYRRVTIVLGIRSITRIVVCKSASIRGRNPGRTRNLRERTSKRTILSSRRCSRSACASLGFSGPREALQRVGIFEEHRRLKNLCVKTLTEECKPSDSCRMIW